MNFLEFSKPGGYALLQRLLGKAPGEVWTEEDRQSLSTAYYYFRQAYEARGGKKLTSTVGDAMLAYMEIYGYQSLRGKSETEIKKLVGNVWEEIALQQEQPAIDVKLQPTEEKGEGLLTKVLPKIDAKKPMKVAFIHDKAPENSGWTYGHELGRRHLERVFHGEVETAAYFNAMEDDPLAVIEQAAAKRLTGRGIRLISSQDLAGQGDRDKSPFGLSLVNEDGQVNLAMSVWKWGAYYEAVLRRIRGRSFREEYQESGKALNYYWGMSAGVVDLKCSGTLPDSVRKLADLLKDGICAGTCDPFRGPLYDQEGRLMAQAGEVLTPERVMNMAWLNENIVGALPAYEELDEIGKSTVSIVGVGPVAKGNVE